MYKPTPNFLAVLAAVAALVCFAGLARADDTVSWAFATQRVDSTPLPIEEIKSTVVRWYDQADPLVLLGSLEVITPGTSIVVARSTTVYNTVCYQAATLDTDGLQSTFTAAVCKTQVKPVKAKPRQPKNVAVS